MLLRHRAAEQLRETLSAEQKSSDPAWAQAWAYVQYGVVTGAAEHAADVVSDSLTADGWTATRVRETNREVTDGFRRTVDGDQWYIEIAWSKSAPDDNESLKILVVSPPTTRGDTEVNG